MIVVYTVVSRYISLYHHDVAMRAMTRSKAQLKCIGQLLLRQVILKPMLRIRGAVHPEPRSTERHHLRLIPLAANFAPSFAALSHASLFAPVSVVKLLWRHWRYSTFLLRYLQSFDSECNAQTVDRR